MEKKSSKVIQKIEETINHETGEIIRTTKHLAYASKRVEFVKLMIDGINTLFNLSKGEYQAIFIAIKESNFDNIIHLDKTFAQTLATLLNKQPQSIFAIFSSLNKKGIVFRQSKGRYELNPSIFWRKDELSRLKRVQYHKEIVMRGNL